MGIVVNINKGVVDSVMLDGHEIPYRILETPSTDDEEAKRLVVGKLAEWVNVGDIANTLFGAFVDNCIIGWPAEHEPLGVDNAVEACKEIWLKCCGEDLSELMASNTFDGK